MHSSKIIKILYTGVGPHLLCRFCYFALLDGKTEKEIVFCREFCVIFHKQGFPTYFVENFASFFTNKVFRFLSFASYLI